MEPEFDLLNTGIDWLDQFHGGVPSRRLTVVAYGGGQFSLNALTYNLKERGIATAVFPLHELHGVPGFWMQQRKLCLGRDYPVIFFITGVDTDRKVRSFPIELSNAAHLFIRHDNSGTELLKSEL